MTKNVMPTKARQKKEQCFIEQGFKARPLLPVNT
jgi:hypothetical protein